MIDSAKKKIFIEASCIAEKRMSGIGHSFVSTLRELIKIESFTSKYEVILLYSFGEQKNIERWGFPKGVVRTKLIPIEKHILRLLLKRRILPPMDMFIGRGIYLFPNYKNWPLRNSKSITYIYDIAYKIFPETVEPGNLAMLQRNIPGWIKNTNKVITISETSKAEIIDVLGVKKSKVDVVYCGVDSQEFRPQTQEVIEVVKSKYGIKNKYILFVGNLEPRKNLEKLLEAFADLSDDVTRKLSLVIVGGGGWLNASILQKMTELKSGGLSIIHPEEYVGDADLPALYSGAEVLVHPAIHEGFGIPPLQALACGTPVVLSDIKVLNEIFGSAGIYVDPNDVKSIVRGIMKGLSVKSSGKNILKVSKPLTNKFSWSNAAHQLAGYIEK